MTLINAACSTQLAGPPATPGRYEVTVTTDDRLVLGRRVGPDEGHAT